MRESLVTCELLKLINGNVNHAIFLLWLNVHVVAIVVAAQRDFAPGFKKWFDPVG